MSLPPTCSPEELGQVAASLVVQAQRLRQGVAASQARVRGVAWHTPWRSEAFRAAYEERGRRGEALSVRLDDLAAAVRREAEAADVELAALHHLEDQVRDRLDELRAAGQPLPVDRDRLPVRGDPGWRDLARRLDIG